MPNKLKESQLTKIRNFRFNGESGRSGIKVGSLYVEVGTESMFTKTTQTQQENPNGLTDLAVQLFNAIDGTKNITGVIKDCKLTIGVLDANSTNKNQFTITSDKTDAYKTLFDIILSTYYDYFSSLIWMYGGESNQRLVVTACDQKGNNREARKVYCMNANRQMLGFDSTYPEGFIAALKKKYMLDKFATPYDYFKKNGKNVYFTDCSNFTTVVTGELADEKKAAFNKLFNDVHISDCAEALPSTMPEGNNSGWMAAVKRVWMGYTKDASAGGLFNGGNTWGATAVQDVNRIRAAGIQAATYCRADCSGFVGACLQEYLGPGTARKQIGGLALTTASYHASKPNIPNFKKYTSGLSSMTFPQGTIIIMYGGGEHHATIVADYEKDRFYDYGHPRNETRFAKYCKNGVKPNRKGGDPVCMGNGIHKAKNTFVVAYIPLTDGSNQYATKSTEGQNVTLQADTQSRAAKCVKYLYDNVFNEGDTTMRRYATCALVGNLMQESGIKPDIKNSLGAFGIAQWLSASYQEKLYKYLTGQTKTASKDGALGNDLKAAVAPLVDKGLSKELTFIGDMLRGSNNALRRYMLGLQTKSGVAPASILSHLENQLSLSTQSLLMKEVESFCRVYERPGEHEMKLQTRLNYATTFFNNWSTYYS
jgi:hypothetical protein